MANKPAQICQLQKGKLVDTQKGFVDTFNWAVQSIANLKGGENCEVSWPTDDTPTIDCNASESGSSGSGGIIEAVYDVSEDTQGGTDGLRIQYVDDRVDKFIPLSSGGGGLSAAVTDVGIQYRAAPTQYDKLSVQYSDGNTKSVNLPLDNAVKDIRRTSDPYYDNVLSVTYTRSNFSNSIPLGVEISGYNNNTTGVRSGFLLSNYYDSNVRFYVSGNQIKLGVYYV